MDLLAGELVAIAILSTLVSRGLRLRVVPNLQRPEPVRRIFSLVGSETAGSLITRINPLIDQLMASFAGVVGGGTLVRYANDVASLPTSVLQATVFPVLLTRLSHEANHPTRFLTTTRRTLMAVGVLLLALSALLIAVRRPLSSLLFMHGVMDRAGVERIADILPWAVIGAAPVGALLVRTAASCREWGCSTARSTRGSTPCWSGSWAFRELRCRPRSRTSSLPSSFGSVCRDPRRLELG